MFLPTVFLFILGFFCEFVNECQKNKTLCGNGSCRVNKNGSATCDCHKTGYNGTFCENDINECTLPIKPPCVFGKCVNTPGSYKCVCDEHYTGQLLVELPLISIF